MPLPSRDAANSSRIGLELGSNPDPARFPAGAAGGDAGSSQIMSARFAEEGSAAKAITFERKVAITAAPRHRRTPRHPVSFRMIAIAQLPDADPPRLLVHGRVTPVQRSKNDKIAITTGSFRGSTIQLLQPRSHRHFTRTCLCASGSTQKPQPDGPRSYRAPFARLDRRHAETGSPPILRPI